MSHAEFIALCESYDTLTEEGKAEAHAEIMCYVLQYAESLVHTRANKRVARFANQYESYLSSRQGW